MPPRGRKPAATAPMPADNALLEPDPAVEPVTSADHADGLLPIAPEPTDEPSAVPLAPRAARTAAAPEPAWHWQVVAGTGAEPCRLCLPFGPPATVGSIGCSHGQWVRVWDGA